MIAKADKRYYNERDNAVPRWDVDDRKIGIFDSGMGGLSVLKTAMKLLPEESFVYFGDDGNAPYGVRPAEEIIKLSFGCAGFLQQKNVKAIVVACNTATSAAINDLRATFQVPVVSMEPAIKPALEQAKGDILMLATPATCALERYNRLRERLDVDGRVKSLPCGGLVELVEKGQGTRENVNKVLEAAMTGIQSAGAIVLGCTHFLFVKEQIRRYVYDRFGAGVKLFDGNFGTARQLARVLEQNGLRTTKKAGAVELYTSGEEQRILPIFKKMLADYSPEESC